MIKLGEVQTLEVIKTTDFGIYLAEEGSDGNTPEFTAVNKPAVSWKNPYGTNHGRSDKTARQKIDTSKVLLPKNQVPAGVKIGDPLEVFIYKDSEDRPIATTSIPALTLGKTALLRVKEVTTIGAFLEWGLAKDLLLPFKEQTARVHTGEDVVVSLYIDKSERLCATMKVYNYLDCNSPYKKDDRVIGSVYEILENFGAFVAVDNRYCALIPTKELHRPLKVGDSVEARVTQVKEDGKLDLSLREKSYVQLDSDGEMIFEKLQNAGGFLPYHDKSDAEAIKAHFNLSKNAFKRAIGRLMKEGRITISDTGITQVKE
ncbi:S1-like domain-containing RNA-binding protein [Anaerocolumna sp. AGMB13025]|uniref:CvfB family protein n=1 Tax=Anaerocolumna sp. AGMB13025 TaxID=3039116 RepID=UPI00241D7506|nr:S1-like domain-containing RNA-binding protein [Anaerocolumna sp. AGMB13025]WFR57819.1 S1-like domain-containing RNA-binding protein [Anaerocolumna sp. AGMB13025]